MKESRPRSARRDGISPQILRAVLRLRELIVTGALPPGQRVPELHLVGSTGVSRTPLRLAMERLEHEGLLERRARGGFIVRAFTPTEIEEAIEFRGVLEGTAARLAAERGQTDEDLRSLTVTVDELDGIVRRLPSMSAFERYVQLNERFHAALMQLPRNEMLRKAMSQIAALPFASPSAFILIQASTPESHRILTIAQEQHRSIVDAIGRREGARSEAIAREHARVALRNLNAALRDREGLRRVPGAALIKLS